MTGIAQRLLTPAAFVLLLAACGESATPLPQVDSGGSGGAPGGAGQPSAGTPATPGAGTSAGGQAGTGGMVASGGSGGESSGAGSGGASTGGVSTGGAGGASADGWVKIFNGQDLTGWSPMIHKSAYKADPYNTFRADATNQVIQVTYQDYPGGNFDERCGLLYFDQYLTDYRVRLTYRFKEPQAQNPVGWGKNNTGLMIFALDPTQVTGDPMFPPLIEIQLLGTPSSGGTNNANLCQPGGMTVQMLHGEPTPGGNCFDSTSGPARPAAEWTTVEAEVHVAGDTKVYQHPDLTTPVLTISGPIYGGKPVLGGYLALQSESQPLEFKDIELKELP
jgi:hypothetical protein